ncbi:MAG TPA: GNAT family N-acetyltransferase [Patescibacteria group bacterium]|nr:GNAT family N-acetyltransferase [Patescibacteria group bacterium]
MTESPTIVGEKVRLRQFSVSDAPEIFKLIDSNREHLSQHDDETAGKYPRLEKVVDSIENPNPRRTRFAIRNEEGKYIGSINFERLQNHPDIAEVGYYMDKEETGKGYTTDALKTLTEYAFTEKDIRLLFALVHPDNKASGKVLSKAGYSYVRDEVLPATELHDNLVFQRYEKRKVK